MSIKQHFARWKETEAAKLRPMTPKQRAGYILHYYRFWFIGLALLLLVGFYIGDAVIQSHKEILLQGFFTNDEYNLFPAERIEKDYAATQTLTRQQRVVFDDALYIDLGGEASEYTAASNGKLTAYMMMHELDFVVTSDEVLEYYKDTFPMEDLEALLPADLREALADQLFFNTDADGKTTAIALDMTQSRFVAGTGADADPNVQHTYYFFVPAGAPQIDEKGILEGVAAQGEAYGRFIDVLPTLTEHKEEYLYYRTDHHWTTLGAYYAYQQFCETLGLTPFDRNAHTAETCEDFYGTHYSKARTWNSEPDTITWYDLQNNLTVWNVTGPGQPTEGTTTGLYDLDKLKVYDKYAMFLHGNNGLSRVEGDGEGKILVIKDSYANSFVPYLTANYAAIDVVDFRNYNYGLDQLIAANDYDQILVLYSYASFTTDPYLYRAGVAG